MQNKGFFSGGAACITVVSLLSFCAAVVLFNNADTITGAGGVCARDKSRHAAAKQQQCDNSSRLSHTHTHAKLTTNKPTAMLHAQLLNYSPPVFRFRCGRRHIFIASGRLSPLPPPSSRVCVSNPVTYYPTYILPSIIYKLHFIIHKIQILTPRSWVLLSVKYPFFEHFLYFALPPEHWRMLSAIPLLQLYIRYLEKKWKHRGPRAIYMRTFPALL